MVVLFSVCMASFGLGSVEGVKGASPVTTRELVYSTIERNPGIHFRELCRVLDKQTGVIQYHLRVLEREGCIVGHRDGRYLRFFAANGENDAQTQEIASMLRRDTTGAIIEVLQESDTPVNHGDIADKLGITSQAVTWNIAKLREADMIKATKDGRQKFYELTDSALECLKAL